MELPLDLRGAIEDALEAWIPGQLGQHADLLSHRYRSQAGGVAVRHAHRPEDVAAYLAVRMPATWGALTASFTQVQAQRPAWTPRTLLDVGSGPGTAMWAAAQIWPTLTEVTLLEREPTMIQAGVRLASSATHPGIRTAKWTRQDLLAAWPPVAADITVAAYVLGELSSADTSSLVEALWLHATDTVVLVEPGTPSGYHRILEARQWLLEQGGYTIAPCPHDHACPLIAPDWCHFSARVARSRRHRQVKGADLGYEDEKFAFVAVSRFPPADRIKGRVIRHPLTRPGQIALTVCAPDGIRHQRVTKKDRPAFRVARHLRWGDSVPSLLSADSDGRA